MKTTQLNGIRRFGRAALWAVSLWLGCCGIAWSQSAKGSNPCPDGKPADLPLPSTLPLDEYEKALYGFLKQRAYRGLGWCVDKGVRDTGPYIDGKYYGTHPAVRIYYSPGVMKWLTDGGRDQNKPIPDGAMIVKEMYTAPAIIWQGLDDAGLEKKLKERNEQLQWTVMVKDAEGSFDGWFWAGPWAQEDGHIPIDHLGEYPFDYPDSGFGSYCIRCHASASDELTFSSLANIEGFPGQPLLFRVDDSWRPDTTQPDPAAAALEAAAKAYAEHSRLAQSTMADEPVAVAEPNALFLETFKAIGPVPYDKVLKIPPETWDRVVSPHGGPEQYLTSDQCMGCHSGYGAGATFGPTMVLANADGSFEINVSPYGEWRWSPMGLAGRDPIFYAQIESELTYIDTIEPPEKREQVRRTVVNLCLSCHGAMGKRQYAIDHPEDPNFKLEYMFATPESNPELAKYGGLGRDGISCAVCHHIDQAEDKSLEHFLTKNTTGQFASGPANKLFGPFEDVATAPMENGLGITPEHNEYVKSSRLCGSCHLIDIPVVDADEPNVSHIEQATYVEWLNSAYQDEFPPLSDEAQSCQQCHMAGGYHNNGIDVDQIQTRIAIVQDTTYPAAEHLEPYANIDVRFREEGFARHELSGLNVFLLSMFDQFNDILGVRKSDYMSGMDNDLPNAIDNMAIQAARYSADLDLAVNLENRRLEATVTVTNKAGHRFPSGVGFRRLFLQVKALERAGGRDVLLWGSGLTNDVGVIVDMNGDPLPTEFLEDGPDGEQLYQRHHETIVSDKQVQIYEELTKNADGRFTTSFIRRDQEIKDNRLLPKGWRKDGPPNSGLDKPSLAKYLEATWPKGGAEKDPRYSDGSGTDAVTYVFELPEGVNPKNVRVEASLCYQSIPPYYLNMRFSETPDGPQAQRLYYLTSNLDLEGTVAEGWKLQVGKTTEAAVKQPEK